MSAGVVKICRQCGTTEQPISDAALPSCACGLCDWPVPASTAVELLLSHPLDAWQRRYLDAAFTIDPATGDYVRRRLIPTPSARRRR